MQALRVSSYPPWRKRQTRSRTPPRMWSLPFPFYSSSGEFRPHLPSLSPSPSSYSTPFERFINVVGLVAAAAAGSAQVFFSIASILQLTLLSASHESSLRKSHTSFCHLRHHVDQLLPEHQRSYRVPGIADRRRTVSS